MFKLRAFYNTKFILKKYSPKLNYIVTPEVHLSCIINTRRPVSDSVGIPCKILSVVQRVADMRIGNFSSACTIARQLREVNNIDAVYCIGIIFFFNFTVFSISIIVIVYMTVPIIVLFRFSKNNRL